jgi:hypothetical protein
MKKVLLLTVIVMFSASLVFAQTGGRIGVFADATGAVESCNIVVAAPGLLSLYVVHIGTTGASASQFIAPAPACMVGATYLSDGAPFAVTIGSSQTGVAIGYGACLSEPIHILTINFFAGGTSETCCIYEVMPDPLVSSGEIETVDCVEELHFAAGQSGVVNGDVSCECAAIVPAQDSSWGKIKSLYN